MQKPTEIDWIRLAAFIDGEGCIMIRYVTNPKRKRRGYHQLAVYVTNTDLRLPRWCQDTFGGTIQTSKTKYQAQVIRPNETYHWTVSAKAAEDILRGCLPYFLIKREQADIGLAFRTTVFNHRARKGTQGTIRLSEDVIQQREKFRWELAALKISAHRQTATVKTPEFDKPTVH